MTEFKDWEEVPTEDLWEDGELNLRAVQAKIIRLMHVGKYKLIREKS